MRTIRYLVAALVMAATLAIPTPAEAHGAYPHNQWASSRCVDRLSWWYVDSADPQHSSADAYHAHAWKRFGFVVQYTAGYLQAEWARYGWECGYGFPVNGKIQWHDHSAGYPRLVQRQEFGNLAGNRWAFQLVYHSTSYFSSYYVQIWQVA